MQKQKESVGIADGADIHDFEVIKNAVIKICIKCKNTGHTSYIKHDEIKNYKS